MKKLIFSLGLSLVTCASMAQDFLAQDILTVPALATGTNGLGAGGVTNLSLFSTNAGIVHAANVVYTNSARVVIRSTGLTNQNSTYRLFNPANLFPDRQGQHISSSILGVVPGSLSNYYAFSGQSLVIELVNPWGSNGPVGMVFAPVWDDEVTTLGRADDWTVVIPGLATSKSTTVTNIPTWKWPGAYGLTLRYMTNEFGNTSASATTNCPYLTKLRVIGYKP